MSKKIAYRRVLLAMAVGLLLAVGLATAQEPSKAPSPSSEAQKKPASVYRLDYVVRELEDGKRINSRNYSVLATSHEEANIRVGSNVPMGKTVSQGTRVSQINIDARLDERDGDIVLSTKFESSSIVTPEKPTKDLTPPPVICSVRFSGNSPVTPGKPTVISMLDDVATNRRYEIEVTVTKMK